MKLALFDFDNTLFETPYEEDPNYMDKPESTIEANSDNFKFFEISTQFVTTFNKGDMI